MREVGNNNIDTSLRHAAEWERVARTLPDEDRRAMALWPSLAPLLFRGDLAAARANALQQIGPKGIWTGVLAIGQ